MKTPILYLFCLSLLVSSCVSDNATSSDESNVYEPKDVMEESTPIEDGLTSMEDYSKIISSLSMKPTKIDSSKKFIRKGGIKFRTKNVFKSTQVIEGIVGRFNGWISKTNLTTQTLYSKSFKFNNDTVLEVKKYSSQNDIILRIPSYKLDTTLKLIAKEIDFLDYRNLVATDITIQLHEQNLKQIRLHKYNSSINQNLPHMDKAKDLVMIANSILEKQEMKDNVTIEKMKKMDEVDYSTIQLTIYGPTKIKEELKPAITKYEDALIPYSDRASESVGIGFAFIKELSLLIITIWPLWIFGGIGFFVYKRLKKSKK